MTSVQATPPLTSAEKFSAASLNLDLEGRPAGLELLGTRSHHNDVVSAPVRNERIWDTASEDPAWRTLDAGSLGPAGAEHTGIKVIVLKREEAVGKGFRALGFDQHCQERPEPASEWVFYGDQGSGLRNKILTHAM